MNTSASLLSVIVPVYNVERYIKSCLDSIINQSYCDLEIILVNDGSTDQSGRICEEYTLRDSRIRLINKQNGGLSSARNTGLEIAKGKYITFIDADDYIDVNTYNDNMEILNKNGDIDILQFPFERQSKYFGKPDKPYLISGEKNIFSDWWAGDIITFSVWNKIYRRDTFNTVRFPLNQVYEDIFLLVDLAEIVQNIYLSDKGCYHYLLRDDSITTSNITVKKCINFYEAHVKVYKKLYSYENLRIFRLMAFSRVCRKLIIARRIDRRANLKGYIDLLKKYAPSWKDIFYTKSETKERLWVMCIKIVGLENFINLYSRYLNVRKEEITL